MLGLYYLYLISIFLSPNFYYFFTGNRDKFIGLSEILLPIICFVNFLYIIILKIKTNYNYKLTSSSININILLLLLYIIGIISLINSPFFDCQTLTFLIKYTLNIILFFQLSYIFTYNFTRIDIYILTIKKLYKVLTFILIFILLLNSIEIFYPTFVHTLYAYVYNDYLHIRFGVSRLTGTVGTPNTNAIIIYFFTGYILLLLYKSEELFSKCILSFIILILLILLILTGSRGGLLAFLVQIILFLYLKYKNFSAISKFQLKLLLLSILFIIGIIFVINNKVEGQLFSIVKNVGFDKTMYVKDFINVLTLLSINYQYIPPALLERAYFIYRGIMAFLNFSLIKKLFGIGLNGSNRILDYITGLNLSSVHNVFIEYLLLTGIVGLLIFLKLIWEIGGYIKEKSDYSPIGGILYFFFVAAIVHSFFESNFMFNIKTMQIFLFLFSMYVAERNNEEHLKNTLRKGKY